MSKNTHPLLSFALAAIGCVLLNPAHAKESNVAANTPVYAVVHVDVEPVDVKVALPMLKSYAQQAAQDPAILHFEVLQQTDAPNHFTFVEVMRSRGAYESFVEEPYVKTMRTQIQPLLGSPFDERLHSAVSVH